MDSIENKLHSSTGHVKINIQVRWKALLERMMTDDTWGTFSLSINSILADKLEWTFKQKPKSNSGKIAFLGGDFFFFSFFYEQVQTLNSHFNLPSQSIRSLPTYKQVWSAVHLSYCTTQTAPHHTLSFQKGEKQQQLSGKCTIILALKNGDWVKIVTVTVAFLKQIWDRGMKSCLNLGT